MATENFKAIETNDKLTLPTLLSAARLVGGAVLGYSLSQKNIEPGAAFGWTIALGATDAEGNLIQVARKFPRLQKALKIIPTAFGRLMDPVADKVYASAILAGGLAGDVIDPLYAVPVLAVEGATAVSTLATKQLIGEDPQVSKVGKAGLIARCSTIGGALLETATSGHAQEVFEYITAGSAVAAVGLGAASCAQIIQTAAEVHQHRDEFAAAIEGAGPVYV